MQQHVLYDRISPLAVLDDLVEIALQHIGDLANLGAQLAIEVGSCQRLPQFVNKFDRHGGEIIDEVEWVLDLVRNTSGQLTERSKLLRLHQTILRGAQILQ